MKPNRRKLLFAILLGCFGLCAKPGRVFGIFFIYFPKRPFLRLVSPRCLRHPLPHVAFATSLLPSLSHTGLTNKAKKIHARYQYIEKLLKQAETELTRVEQLRQCMGLMDNSGRHTDAFGDNDEESDDFDMSD